MIHYKAPSVLDAQMFMQTKYDTAFGVFDHFGPDNPEVPWPHLYVSPNESLLNADPLDFRLDQHAENKVFDIFGIPFHEMIRYTRYDLLKVLASAKKHNATLVRASSAGMGELERILKQHATANPANNKVP